MRLVILSVLLGCVTEPVPLTPTAEPSQTTPPPPEVGVRVEVIGAEVPPGTEVERCAWIHAGNSSAASIRAVSVVATPGLHHAIISRIDGIHAPSEEPCVGFPGGAFAGFLLPKPLFATSTQVSTESLTLPDGVGVAVAADQLLVVDYHWLNTTDASVTPHVTVDLTFNDPGAPVEEAGFYWLGAMDEIAIPPGGTQTLDVSCPFPAGTELVSLTPHQHQLGTSFAAWRSREGAPDEPLFASDGWFDPESAVFDPPLVLAEGDALTVSCAWSNPGETLVTFGEDADDEMCFVFGFLLGPDRLALDGAGCSVVTGP